MTISSASNGCVKLFLLPYPVMVSPTPQVVFVVVKGSSKFHLMFAVNLSPLNSLGANLSSWLRNRWFVSFRS